MIAAVGRLALALTLIVPALVVPATVLFLWATTETRGLALDERPRTKTFRAAARSRHLDIRFTNHHDVEVRTTLTLDEDVARELRARMRQSGQSLKQVVNAALRRGLRLGEKPAPGLPRFEVEPFSSPFQAGVDPSRLNQLLDELEVEDFAVRVARQGARA